MYYIYILRCADQSLYTGMTTDINRRFQEHVKKTSQGAKYTRSHKPIAVVALWSCSSRQKASRLEYWIKHLKKSQKEEIIVSQEKFADYLNAKVNIEDYQKM